MNLNELGIIILLPENNDPHWFISLLREGNIIVLKEPVILQKILFHHS